MKTLTVQQREQLIGKLCFAEKQFLRNDKQADLVVIKRMIANLLKGHSPILEKYYHTSFDEVREIFESNNRVIWKYLTKLAEKQDKNIFEFMGQYYESYSGYEYDYFGVLVVNIFLRNRSEEILQALKPNESLEEQNNETN